MKNSYTRPQRRTAWSVIWVFMLALFVLPSLSFAQDLDDSFLNYTSFVDTQVGQTTQRPPNVTNTNTVVRLTVNGQDLTNDVQVTVAGANPNDFRVSLINGSGFTNTVTVPVTDANNGNNTRVYIQFAPTAVGNRSASIVLTSGSVTRSFTVSGTAVAAPPTLTANPNSLSFAPTRVGETSAVQSFVVTGTNLTGSVTIVRPINFRLSTNGTTFTNSNITLSGASGSVSTTIYVQFAPTQAVNISENIVISTPNGSGTVTQNVAVNGNGQQAVTSAITYSINPLNFGTVSTNGSSTLTTIVTATGLAPNSTVTLTPSATNIRFRLTGVGTYNNTPITLTTDASGNVTQEIQVRLVGTNAGAFSGSIVGSGVSGTNTTITGTLNITANGLGGNSAINASGVLSLFSTVPGVPSAIQTYQLSGTNLLEGVTVNAPIYFQVALSAAGLDALNGATGNSLLIPRNSGNDLTVTTVYIRYLPPSAREDATVITHTSDPANPVTFPVSGTSRPQVQLANAYNTSGIVVIYENSPTQALNLVADRVRQPITITISAPTPSPQNPSATPQFQVSTDGINFSSSVVFTPSSTTYSVNATLYVRYSPTYLGQASNTLRYQSTDFEITTAQNFANNGTLAGRSIDEQPTAERPFLLTRSGRNITITFTGNVAGQGEGHLVVASENPLLPANRQPVDGTSYQTNNSIYGTGPQLAPGYFSVYAGANNSVTVENFEPTKAYYFYVFEFNNIDPTTGFITQTSENYLTPTTAEEIEGVGIDGQPLPVTLTAFSAKLQNKQVKLTWVTASEKNNKGFEVQRSADGVNFQTFTTVEGNGTTSSRHEYAATDANPLTGTSYYRLKQVDFDGQTAYSDVKSVVNGGGSLSVYPNPAQNNLTVKLPVPMQNAKVQVLDLTGRVLLTRTLGVDGNLELSSLQRGTYLVRVEQGGQQWTQKVVKQ
ncbi:T9SS type A sorting domain-containing protein [Hymenobacter lutimineralis]|uniref:T9SS type A sorting domain-containing protein n=1 Tax=Hymenobacter lutimineralis TaxID=2606448 RepID=A0A5D6VHP0_9BACT|nr:T9SS type A sorting domain-containing protein [Hymenobacter lutimineralis]